jgi:hypothetical protein
MLHVVPLSFKLEREYKCVRNLSWELHSNPARRHDAPEQPRLFNVAGQTARVPRTFVPVTFGCPMSRFWDMVDRESKPSRQNLPTLHRITPNLPHCIRDPKQGHRSEIVGRPPRKTLIPQRIQISPCGSDRYGERCPITSMESDKCAQTGGRGDIPECTEIRNATSHRELARK